MGLEERVQSVIENKEFNTVQHVFFYNGYSINSPESLIPTCSSSLLLNRSTSELGLAADSGMISSITAINASFPTLHFAICKVTNCMKLRSRCDSENVNSAFPLSGILGHPTDICGDTSLGTRSLVP